MVALLATPLMSICQIDPPPDPPAGVNPDVPFDDNMNLLFLAVGIVFVAFIIVKQLRKRAIITSI